MDIVFVTNNMNKLSEIRSLISSNYNLMSLEEINFNDEIKETESTLEGNALLKARHIFSKYKLNCFADDTGLEVDFLDGAPGVYSARYAGPNCLAKDNIEKVLNELKDANNRKAKFITVIALIIEGEEFVFKGECRGVLIKKPIGSDGFGYDPIFLPNGSNLTFAQMDKDEKGKISHRGLAVKKLLAFLSARNN
tara:strand:- start:159 stop:740 length:582 start_codon:yes stop_codon:yes gene_type:complete